MTSGLRHNKIKLTSGKDRKKKIEIFNSVVGADGKKRVPITIHFRAAGIITVPDEKEIIATIEGLR